MMESIIFLLKMPEIPKTTSKTFTNICYLQNKTLHKEILNPQCTSIYAFTDPKFELAENGYGIIDSKHLF
jgi:hypothetical protein